MMGIFSNKTIISKNIKEYNKSRAKEYRNRIFNAPFNVLRFDPFGIVKTCCYANDVVGKWPQNTINDIVASQKRRLIQKTISHNILPDNCEICKAYFSSGNLNSLKIKDFDHPITAGNAKIQRMEFSLENDCNLKCIMCSDYKSNNHNLNSKLKPVYNTDFLEQLLPYIPDLKTALFLGGEPLIIKLYYDIWEVLIRKNPDCNIHVTTNGTVINNSFKEIIEKGKFSFVVSIDALRKELYERIRINGNFEITLKNLDFLIAYTSRKQTTLDIAVCPMTVNWKEIPKIANFAKEKNINFCIQQLIQPIHLALWPLQKSELQIIRQYLTENNPFDSSEFNFKIYTGLINDIDLWKEKEVRLSAKLHKTDKKEFIDAFVKHSKDKLNIPTFDSSIIENALNEYDDVYFTEELLQLMFKTPIQYLLGLHEGNYGINTLKTYITYQIYISIFNK